jgi:hypothetical protein
MEYCFEYDLVTSEQSKDSSKTDSKPNENLLMNFDQVKLEILDDNDQDIDPYEQLDSEKPHSDSLEAKYNNIWSKFLNYLDVNFDEFVSLNHLGLVLRYLKSNEKSVVNRVKPPYLEFNIPNLIICPQDEIIKRTLSIYSFGGEQVLPTNDEVLFCTSRTRYEEIELFWKRCLFDWKKRSEDDKTGSQIKQEQKIYSLINVQDLLYDQAVKAQTLFEKCASAREQRSSSEQSNFILCVLCSSEKEDKSIFVTAFNRYRKNIPLEPNVNQSLLEYLSSHFKTQDTVILFQ